VRENNKVSKRLRHQQKQIPGKTNSLSTNFPQEVPSLLDVMKEGHEYESILPYTPPGGQLVPDLKRAILEIESIRQRPLVCYVANVIKGLPGINIDFSDDLPFNEAISKIPDNIKSLDILVVTPGGLGQQVAQFVNALRPRFDSVEFILPFMCMSAGTLWVLSGDKIWMDSRAYIGPIDPQVPSKSGDSLPAQSILILLEKIRAEGEEALRKGVPPPWHLIRLLDTMDQRQVGGAISASEYSIKLASNFLENYKFKNWIVHNSSGQTVTDSDRKARALEVATRLCDNSYWKSHGHGINREIADKELRLVIDHLESDQNFHKAIRRIWALFYYTLERTFLTKVLISSNYTLVRQINSNPQQ
jgi:hypothetical protein